VTYPQTLIVFSGAMIVIFVVLYVQYRRERHRPRDGEPDGGGDACPTDANRFAGDGTNDTYDGGSV
jgi:hypothetical protein